MQLSREDSSSLLNCLCTQTLSNLHCMLCHFCSLENPQVKDITSMETATLQSLDLEVRNTNPLLRNMPQVTGLKTGTTNKSGACLVTSLVVDNTAIKNDLVVVVLGTEDSIERGRVSALLHRRECGCTAPAAFCQIS